MLCILSELCKYQMFECEKHTEKKKKKRSREKEKEEEEAKKSSRQTVDQGNFRNMNHRRQSTRQMISIEIYTICFPLAILSPISVLLLLLLLHLTNFVAIQPNKNRYHKHISINAIWTRIRIIFVHLIEARNCSFQLYHRIKQQAKLLSSHWIKQVSVKQGEWEKKNQ